MSELKMQLKMIDTHCHLEQNEFISDLEEIIQEAQGKGIFCITSAITPEDWQRGLQIASGYDNVFVSLGLDPLNSRNMDQLLSTIEMNQDDIVAIGEIGLDHYRERDHAEREIQENNFRKGIELSKKLKIPIQIHSRSAGRSALEVLSDMDSQDVHMHAFDGKSSLARMASNDLGYYFSIPTSVVRSPQKQKLVKAVNIERLLIETDSPVLAPERGMRNTPLNLPIVIQELARILRRAEEELQEIILENTLRLYSRIRF
ncbi:MAG: TatD family hydrolase [Candidatus Thorarchaeota archaeon]